MARFEDQFTIQHPPAAVFDFFSVTRNHEKMSAGSLGLSFIAAPERFELGSRLEFQIQGLGQVQTAVHEIIEFERPHRYLERQIKGPMKAWRHEHLFVEDEGQTIVIDRIEFEPPGGLLGLLATESRILESLEDGIYSRNVALQRLLSAGAGHAP
jgi:ligand-binding SRPBCC domain-containing protein